jgi:predicted small secreted protein
MIRLRHLAAATLLLASTTLTACSRTHTAGGDVGEATSAFSDTTEVGDVTDAGSVADSIRSVGDRLRGVVGRAASAIGLGSRRREVPPYTGTDARGVPHYARREFTDDERQLLRAAYGIEDPNRLYVSDSTEGGLLKYDTRVKRCRSCYVNSYRVGFVSVRRPGETWEQAERRIRSMRPRDFSPAARVSSNRSLADLDPTIREDVERMLADARRAGFAVRIVATYRSPKHEAYLMAIGGGRTMTLTSLHSYGRAIDVIVGDGNLNRRSTRAQWIAFRRWVSRYDGDTFRILGTPDRTWDWRHVEMPTSSIGFRTIEAALERARRCERTHCDFPPRLPDHLR